MNTTVKKLQKAFRHFIVSVLSVGFLLSCGDPVTTYVVASVIDAGVGGTGIVRGIITGFGSVYVNGIKFEIDEENTSFEVDGDTQTNQSDLSIGMLVTINGTINADGVTGTAESVVYDDEIEGPINSAPSFVVGSDEEQKQLTILDYTIVVDALSTHYENTSFDTLALNDVVEISGYTSAPNTLIATLVKKKDTFIPNSTEVELKGSISNLDLNSSSFNLNTIVIHYSSSTDIELESGSLINGLFVEVEGILQADGSIVADEIEEEDNKFSSEDGEISLSGKISAYVDNTNFKINGQLIDASNAQELSPSNALTLLANGISIEVDGSIIDSVFVVEEIEVKVKDIKISGLVNTVGTDGLSIMYSNIAGSIDIVTNNSTQFEDESNEEIQLFSLSNIVPTNYVEIEATLINNEIVATQIQRDEPDDFILQGQVDAFVANTSITILGITYTVDGDTDYDGFTGASNFFNTMTQGEIVRIKDENADGIADKVKIDD